RPVQLTMILALLSLITREKSVSLADLFKTPHDWMMFLFFAWVIVASPSPFDTFKSVSNLMLFYVVIIQALTTEERLSNYLFWWTIMITFIAALAVASEFGIDPLYSYDLTHGRMLDRLSLNLSIFNNPNALGHSMVPAIPMIYYF